MKGSCQISAQENRHPRFRPRLFSAILLGLTAAFDSSLIAEVEAPSPYIARLGRIPDWSVLDDYQYTITREEFTYLLNHCYARKGEEEYRDLIRIERDRALILKQSNHPAAGWYDLRFQTASLISEPPKRFWRRPTEMDDLPSNSTRPLSCPSTPNAAICFRLELQR